MNIFSYTIHPCKGMMLLATYNTEEQEKKFQNIRITRKIEQKKKNRRQRRKEFNKKG
jgi:hypothetical protein